MSTTIEKILNELQEVGKATAMIVADSLGLEPGIAVAMLNSQVKAGNAKCLNGFYSITDKGRDYSPETATPAKTKNPAKAAKPKCEEKAIQGARKEKVAEVGSGITENATAVDFDPLTGMPKDIAHAIPQIIWGDYDFMTLSIPTPEYLTKQIRKHEADAKRLKKLRSTIRSLQRQNIGGAK